MTANVSARVIDNGLTVLDTETDRLFICSQEPLTYPEANIAYRLGLKTFAPGALFGAPQAGTTDGRKVTTVAFADGLVTTTGTATHWAVCDSVNLRLLATGTLAAPTAVVNSAAFGLPSFSVQVSVSMGLAISGVALLATALTAAAPAFGTSVLNSAAVGWKTLPVGAGGFIVGLDMHSDGTIVNRTDSFGAYIYDRDAVNPGNAGGLGAWRQLVTTTSMASSSAIINTPHSTDGVYEIRMAPANSDIIYMCYRSLIFVSTNGGVTFTQTAFSPVTLSANAEPARKYGYKMAVDPANSNVVYIATSSNGAFKTEGGTTGGAWSAVSGVAANDGNIVGAVAFDHTSGTTGGKTNTIYIAVSGTGLYRSTNAGTSFSLMSGTPTQLWNIRIAADGTLYGTTNGGILWKLSGTTWTNITPPTMAAAAQCVMCHPTIAANLVAMTGTGGGCMSSNAGSTWTTRNGTTSTWVATDCPWLATLNSPFFCWGMIACVWDPMDTSKMWSVPNQGVWTCALPLTSSPTPQVFTSVNAGIEQLVSNQALSVPGHAPLFLYHDVGMIRKPSLTLYPPTQTRDLTAFLNNGHWADYASNNANFVCAVINRFGDEASGYSTDGGATWNDFGGYPSNLNDGGSIAAASSTNMVWVQSNEGGLWYTTNGGTSWSRPTFGTPMNSNCDGNLTTSEPAGETTITLPDVGGLVVGGYLSFHFTDLRQITNISGNDVTFTPGLSVARSAGDYYYALTGWGGNSFYLRAVVCADRVSIGTFYAQNAGVGPGGTGRGTWKSTNGGASWTLQSNTIDFGFNSLLRSVPGNAGHLFFTSGTFGSGGEPASSWPHANPFYYSTNGGATWTDVGNLSGNAWTIREVWSFGFGKEAPGQSYPAIYIYGWVAVGSSPASRWINSCRMALDKSGVTWEQIGPQYPVGWPETIRAVEGDKNTYGIVYLGHGGSGFEYLG